MRTLIFLLVVTAMCLMELASWIIPPSSRNAVQRRESADPPAIEQTGSFEDQAITD
jgi:hypothetical protein